jgi:hypothetical protein
VFGLYWFDRKDLLKMAPGTETCRKPIFVVNRTLLSGFIGGCVNCADKMSVLELLAPRIRFLLLQCCSVYSVCQNFGCVADS